MVVRVKRVDHPDGVELALPPRPLPRILGWALAIFGLVGTVFMLFWIGDASGVNNFAAFRHQATSGFGMAQLLFAAFGLPGLLGALALLIAGIGLASGASRCSVIITSRCVRLREQLGPLRWSWTVPLDEVRALAIAEIDGSQRFTALMLRRAGRKDLPLAMGYPVSQVKELATALERELRSAGVAVDVMEDFRLGPPPGNLHVEEAGGRIAIDLVRPTRPWYMVLFVVAWLVVATGMWFRLHPQAEEPLAVVLAVVWVIGLGAGLATLHKGWRHVALLWDGATLSLIDRSPLRSRLTTWSRAEIADIGVEQRGSGSGRYQALTITPRGGKPRDLPLVGDPVAREWISARLRQLVLGQDPPAPRAL